VLNCNLVHFDSKASSSSSSSSSPLHSGALPKKTSFIEIIFLRRTCNAYNVHKKEALYASFKMLGFHNGCVESFFQSAERVSKTLKNRIGRKKVVNVCLCKKSKHAKKYDWA